MPEASSSLPAEPEPDRHPLEDICDQLDRMIFSVNTVGGMALLDGDGEYVAVANRTASNLQGAVDGFRRLASIEAERCTCGRCGPAT